MPLIEAPVPLYELSEAVEFTPELEKEFRPWLERLTETKKAFTVAKEYLLHVLREGAAFVYQDERRNLESAARFVARCMTLSRDPIEWDRHPSHITKEISELLSRTRTDNHNYRVAMSSARSAAYESEFPELWHDFPPSPSMLESSVLDWVNPFRR